MMVAWSPGDTCIARCDLFAVNSSSFQPVRLYDATTGTALPPLTGHQGAILAIAFSPDGKHLAGGGFDKRVHIWDIATGKEVILGQTHAGQVNGVAFRPDGKILASAGTDNSVRLWDLATGKWQRTLTGHDGSVTGVAFHKNGKLLASGGGDGTMQLWDLAANKDRTLKGHQKGEVRVAFSPDGQTLASAGHDGFVKLWGLDADQARHSLSTDSKAHGLAFSPDGQTVAVGCEDGGVRLWEATTGLELPAPQLAKGAAVLGVAFHPTEPLLAVCGPQADGLRLWDLAAHKEKPFGGSAGPARCCLWGAGGKVLISASSKGGTVRLWDLSGKTPRSKVIPLGKTEILGMALSPEGCYLATANANGTIYILKLAKAGEVVPSL
jgi:WD40 repeat protein